MTSYQFTHAGEAHHHADIAHVTAVSDALIKVTNNPAARTQGRAHPFTNEIEAQLTSRHLVGYWRNVSDTRYFGMVHLAILPGETVMDGHYTGFASDIGVSVSRWRWVRLDGDQAAVSLRDPAEIYDLVFGHSEYDSPLTVADVREDA